MAPPAPAVAWDAMSRPFPAPPSRAWRWRLAACALAIFVLQQPKARAEWVAVNPAAGDRVAAYDTTRARLAEGVLEVWTREQGASLRATIVEDYRRRGLSPVQVQEFGERFAQRLTKWRVDCDKRLARVLAVGDYDVGGAGTFISEAQGEDGVIWPDSAVDAATQALCGKSGAKSKAATRSAPRRAPESRPK